MSNKNLFNIFLVSVLLLAGVYFVIGGSYFSTPSNNVTYIKGNYTIAVTYSSGFTNVSSATFLNISSDGNLTRSMFLNITYPYTNGSSISFVLNTNTNYTGDGNHTVGVYLSNESSGALVSQFINVTFLVDNTAPDVTLIYPYMNKTFIDEDTIYFAFNVTDSMSGNYTYGNTINCSLFIDGASINDSIVVWNTTDFTPQVPIRNSSLVGGSDFTNASINASYVMAVSATSIISGPGDHIWNLTCRDYNNNVNNTAKFNPNSVHDKSFVGGNFTLTDTVRPTTSVPTFSASSVVKDAAVTVTCTGTDAITANPIEDVSVKAPNGNWQYDLGTSPHSFTGTNIAGTWTAKCRSRDSVGTGAFGSEATFTVTTATSNSDSTSTSGSSSSSSKPVKVVAYAGQTQDLGSLATSAGGEGIINAYQSSTVTFSVTTSSESSSSSHSVRFDEVSYIDGTVTVTISSDPIILTLSVGDVETIDLEGDGVDDLQVTLNSIDSNGKADMIVKDLGAVTATETTEDTTGVEEETVTGSGGGLGAIWWILIIVVIIVIVVLVLPKKKRK